MILLLSDSWPPGKYCIYKKGHECPSSMEEGFVIWDDENTDNQNEVGGSVPEGLYSDDTKIYFCCKTDGSVDRPVQLPIQSDFLLFAYQSTKCQKVCRINLLQCVCFSTIRSLH